MNTIKDEVTSACDVAVKSALGEFGKALMEYWPALLAIGLTGQASERVKSAAEASIDRIYAANLVGLNVADAENMLEQLSAGDGVHFKGKIGDLAVKGAGPGTLCEISDEKTITLPLPVHDELSGALDIRVNISSALRTQDRKWDTKAAIDVTLTGTWSWKKDFGACASSK
jgi:hypothetical protein